MMIQLTFKKMVKLVNQPIGKCVTFCKSFLGGAPEKCVSPYFSSEKMFRKTIRKEKQRQTRTVYFMMGFLGDYWCPSEGGIPNFFPWFFE